MANLLGQYVSAHAVDKYPVIGVIVKQREDGDFIVICNNDENYLVEIIRERIIIHPAENEDQATQAWITKTREMFELTLTPLEANLVGHYVKSSTDMKGPVHYGIVISQTGREWIVIDETGKPHKVRKEPFIVDSKQIPPRTRAWITEVRLSLELHPDFSSHQPEPAA